MSSSCRHQNLNCALQQGKPHHCGGFGGLYVSYLRLERDGVDHALEVLNTHHDEVGQVILEAAKGIDTPLLHGCKDELTVRA